MSNHDVSQAECAGDLGRKVPAVTPDVKGNLTVPEILAPVGGREQFFAALNSGADAVFLGLKQFNARARAENFTVEELKTLVPLAHRYGMRVLVTLNILIKDQELEDVIDTLAALEHIGVDAIIVQDLGVAKLAHEHFPGLRLHASTQMAVHNLAGVKAAAKYGFKRVVLARELTAEEIKRISRTVDVELEVFCHGSLCYSYSGLCFFSGAADARSGNRGECAYTCREPYKVISEPGHGFLFSMRDLDTSSNLDHMVAAGVHALKIEGRKKDAQYVSSVVKLYRKKLDQIFGRSTLRDNAPPAAKTSLDAESSIRKDLQLSFQRKTTSFFFEGRYHENVIDLNNPTHHGVRVGIIEEINGSTVRVRLEDEIEKYDGLRIVSADKLYHAKPQDGDQVISDLRSLDRRYENMEVSFSLRDLSFKGRKIFEAASGMLVDIDVPNFSDRIRMGDILFKARSNDLKQRVEALSAAPSDERLRPMTPVEIKIIGRILDDGALSMTVTVKRLGVVVGNAGVVFPNAEIRNKGDLAADLRDVFSIFGDQGVYSESLELDLGGNYFVPRSLLKDLKRRVEADLVEKIARIHHQHAEAAKSELTACIRPLPSQGEGIYSVKIDRLEYLPWLESSEALGALSEVIFEPKKMFLPGLKPEVFLAPLREFHSRTQVKIRLAFPTIIRTWDEPVLKVWFQAALAEGFAAYEVGNPGALELIQAWGLPCTDVASDFTLYAMNREAAKHWLNQGVSRMALSIEDDASSLSQLLSSWPEGVEPQVIVYKDTPLFVAEACSLTALHNGCPTNKVCGYRTLEVENRRGERFFVGHEGCKSIVYGARPFALSGHQAFFKSAGVRSYRVDFLTRPYTREQFTDVWAHVLNDQVIPESHSANFNGRLK